MDAKKTETVAQAVLSYLTSMLMRGELAPGSGLPSDVELATRLDVSVASLKEAMKVMSVLGVVETSKGQGLRVAQKPSDAMLNPLIAGLLLEQGTKQDLYELRVIIEVSAIELAINKGDVDALQALADNLRKYEGRMLEGDKESLAELDRLFHQQVLEMSGNPLLIRLGRTISHLYALPLTRALGAWGPEQILANHKAVYQAIKDKDVNKARELVTKAFERSKEFY